jgi:hypothetical protein
LVGSRFLTLIFTLALLNYGMQLFLP